MISNLRTYSGLVLTVRTEAGGNRLPDVARLCLQTVQQQPSYKSISTLISPFLNIYFLSGPPSMEHLVPKSREHPAFEPSVIFLLYLIYLYISLFRGKFLHGTHRAKTERIYGLRTLPVRLPHRPPVYLGHALVFPGPSPGNLPAKSSKSSFAFLKHRT